MVSVAVVVVIVGYGRRTCVCAFYDWYLVWISLVSVVSASVKLVKHECTCCDL